MAVMSLHRKLFFLLVFFLPTQLGFHFWPSWSSILGRHIDYLSPTVFFTDLLVFGMLIIWLLETKLYNSFVTYFRTMNFKSKVIVLCTGIFIWLNIVFAHNPSIAIIAWAKLFEYGVLCFYIYQQRITWKDAIVPLAIGTMGISIIGISQYMAQRSIGGVLWFVGERTFMADTPGIARVTLCHIFTSSCELHMRAYATFSHPNVLGGYLAIILPLLFLALMEKKYDRLMRGIYCTSLTLGIVALVVSFSRSAWLVSAFGFVSVYFLKQKSIGLRFPIILALSLIVLLGFLVAPIQDESVVVRQKLNMAALSIWQQSPFVGIGLNNFLFGLSPTLRTGQVYILQPVHNIYLLTLAQIGIIGWGFVLGYLVLFMQSVRGYVRTVTPLHISLLSLLMLGLVDHYLFTLQQGQLLFSLIIAMCAVATRFHQKV